MHSQHKRRTERRTHVLHTRLKTLHPDSRKYLLANSRNEICGKYAALKHTTLRHSHWWRSRRWTGLRAVKRRCNLAIYCGLSSRTRRTDGRRPQEIAPRMQTFFMGFLVVELRVQLARRQTMTTTATTGDDGRKAAKSLRTEHDVI